LESIRFPVTEPGVDYQLNICFNTAEVKSMADTFGHNLRELRRAKGVSQRELAEKVGVDFSYISKVENDRLPPPAADTIVKICEELGFPPDELLASIGKMPTDVKERLSTSTAALEFVRQAHEMKLTEDEWKTLTKRLRRLRSE
jgi:transcriptional regulator with XRE-family HTH domain